MAERFRGRRALVRTEVRNTVRVEPSEILEDALIPWGFPSARALLNKGPESRRSHEERARVDRCGGGGRGR